MNPEKPILFSGPMVRAILEGRKTQTRRIVKLPLRCTNTGCELTPRELSQREINSLDTLCPYGGPGNRLWVRETFALDEDDQPVVFYRATDHETCGQPWKPSIYMPRWASRITLEITGVRIERLQDIGKDGRKAHDVKAEGITDAQIEGWRKWLHPDDAPAHTFGVLWNSINGKKHPWKSNPWVWVIEFRK